jgi:hypothetical protein
MWEAATSPPRPAAFPQQSRSCPRHALELQAIKNTLAKSEMGPFATGSSQQEVRTCPLLPEGGSSFRALATPRRAVAG